MSRMKSPPIDPRTFTLIKSTYHSIVTEMAISVERSSWSHLLSLMRDFSVSIIDRDFQQIVVADEILPGQAVSLQRFIKNMAAFFGDNIADGDVLLSNSPYLGSLHLGEIAVASPVFYRGELLFWTAVRGHMIDMGSPAPASTYPYTRDLYSEGLKIPPVKLYEGGKLRKDLLDLYLMNLRYRTLSYGDLLAHVAGTWVGKERLIEFVEQHGVDTIKRYTDELLDHTDRMVAAEIRKMRPGTYFGEDWVDTNSYGTKNISVRVKLTVRDDRWIVDLTDNPRQMLGGINCTLAGITEAAVASTLGYCIDPAVPKNEGLCRHYEIICPEGNIFHAQPPYATQIGVNVSGDALYRALLRAAFGACPEMVVAGSTHIRGAWFSGIDHRGGRDERWGFVEISEEGGGGAAYGADGWPCMGMMESMGANKFPSIEMVEWLFPVLVEQSEIYPGTAGPGRWRGAPGVQFAMRLDGSSPAEVYTITNGSENPPHGVAGGGPGSGAVTYVYPAAVAGQRVFYSSQGGFLLPTDAVYGAISSGGGGYGDPLKRDPDEVVRDVRDEIVSFVSAHDDYGVVLDKDRWQVDREATLELRERLLSARPELPSVSPTTPGAATLRARVMAEGDEYVDLDREPYLA